MCPPKRILKGEPSQVLSHIWKQGGTLLNWSLFIPREIPGSGDGGAEVPRNQRPHSVECHVLIRWATGDRVLSQQTSQRGADYKRPEDWGRRELTCFRIWTTHGRHVFAMLCTKSHRNLRKYTWFVMVTSPWPVFGLLFTDASLVTRLYSDSRMKRYHTVWKTT